MANEIRAFFDDRDGSGMTTRLLDRPLPREIEEEGGKFVLDYAGNFTAAYNWVPDEPKHDPKFEEWYDHGE